MYITYLGHSCFKLEGKETQAVLITDPYDKSVGLRVPKMVADIVTISHNHKDHSNVSNVSAATGDVFVIDSPGEYEVKKVFVYGMPSYHDNAGGKERGENIIYRIEMDGISFAHLGDLGHLLNGSALEKLEGVDVLFVPVGGKYTLDAKEASQLISSIEPRIVIPMHYKTEGIILDIDGVDKFLKEMGTAKTEPVDKLKLVEKDLPQGVMEVVVMAP
ncbi:MAG: MBL fold metallo-hydrolase [bacterium]